MEISKDQPKENEHSIFPEFAYSEEVSHIYLSLTDTYREAGRGVGKLYSGGGG